MESPIGYNVYNTAFLPPKIMVYFEKTKLMEIYIEIIKMLEKKRVKKENVDQLISKRLENISADCFKRTTFLYTPKEFCAHTFTKKYSEIFKSFVVQYTDKRKPNDMKEILTDLYTFLDHYKLRKKNLIILNFPKDRYEALQCHANKCRPDLVLELANKKSNIKQLKGMYKEKYGFIHTNQSIAQMARRINSAIRHQDLPRQIIGKFVPRCILIGRRGSGRKIQAAALALEFNLVYIDVEFLLLSHIITKSCECFDPKTIASILLERLLEPDCISNGWIVVGYPYSKIDLDLILSNDFVVPPNKIIFLHTRERVCLRRLMKRQACELCIHPRDEPVYVCLEMEYFNHHIRDMVEMCSGRKETIHIDGNHSVETVKTAIWARVIQTQRF